MVIILFVFTFLNAIYWRYFILRMFLKEDHYYCVYITILLVKTEKMLSLVDELMRLVPSDYREAKKYRQKNTQSRKDF